MATYYSYKFLTRHTGLVIAAIYFLMGITFSLWGILGAEQFEFGSRQVKGLSIIWGIVLFLLLVAFFFGKRIYIFLQPIELSANGIRGSFRLHAFEWWPKNVTDVMAWADIDRLEFFSYPDNDAMKMKKWSGMRIISGDRKIVIYDKIQNYAVLRSEIKKHISDDKIDSRVKAVFYDKLGNPRV